MLKPIITIAILFMSASSTAFVRSRSSLGTPIAWPGQNLSLEVDTRSSDLGPSEVESVVADSIQQWNGKSNINLSASYQQADPSSANSIRFVQGAEYFSSGVIAVTRVTFYSRSGDIVEAKIELNDSNNSWGQKQYQFTNDRSTTGEGNRIYLGDVMTHELGHFLGLGHSEALDSSMVFTAFLDQHTIHDDDTTGLRDIYGAQRIGVIKGRVVGGAQIGILGAHVQAISVRTGEVASVALTNEDGSFSIKGLEEDEHYVLYVVPPRSVSSLPPYYSGAQRDVCPYGNYVGSFYSSCGDAGASRANSISLEQNSVVDVGVVSVRCESSFEQGYMAMKDAQDAESVSLILPNAAADRFGAAEVFYGHFPSQTTSSDPNNSVPDRFVLDLRDYPVQASESYFVDLKMIVSGVGSVFDASIEIQRQDWSNPLLIQSESLSQSNRRELDLKQKVALDSNNPANNLFTLKITPRRQSFDEEKRTIPSPFVFEQDENLYLLLVNVGLDTGSGLELLSFKGPSFSDNAQCVDAPNTQIASSAQSQGGSNGQGSLSSSSSGSGSSGGCGTIIDVSKGSGPGQGGAAASAIPLAFLMCLALFMYRWRVSATKGL